MDFKGAIVGTQLMFAFDLFKLHGYFVDAKRLCIDGYVVVLLDRCRDCCNLPYVV